LPEWDKERCPVCNEPVSEEYEYRKIEEAFARQSDEEGSSFLRDERSDRRKELEQLLAEHHAKREGNGHLPA